MSQILPWSRRTSFHFEFNDLDTGKSKTRFWAKHSTSPAAPFLCASLPIEEKVFFFAHFTRQNIFLFQKTKNGQNQRAKLIFWKWVKLLLYNFGLFQRVFENLKLNKLVKEERRLDLEDRIWRLKFGKSAVLKLHFEEWIWKLVLLKG